MNDLSEGERRVKARRQNIWTTPYYKLRLYQKILIAPLFFGMKLLNGILIRLISRKGR